MDKTCLAVDCVVLSSAVQCHKSVLQCLQPAPCANISTLLLGERVQYLAVIELNPL